MNYISNSDYYPAEIPCPENLVENNGNPVQTNGFDYIPGVYPVEDGSMQMFDRSYVLKFQIIILSLPPSHPINFVYDCGRAFFDFGKRQFYTKIYYFCS